MLGTIAWRKKKEPLFGHVLSIFRSRRFIIRPEICGRLRTATAAAGWVLAMASDTEGKVRNQSTYSCVCVWVWVFGLFGHLRNLHSRRRNVCPTGGWRRGMDSRFRDERVGALFRKVQLAVMTYELLRHGSGAWRARWVWLNCEMGFKIYLKTMGTTS